MAQPSEDPLAELRKLGARESPGAVPVIYVESAEERALGYRKSLEAAHSWYQKQFHVQVPITLLVLDRKTWEKFGRAPWPMPHIGRRYGFVVVPAQFEDFGARHS
jgi:hypothetical protein